MNKAAAPLCASLSTFAHRLAHLPCSGLNKQDPNMKECTFSERADKLIKCSLEEKIGVC